ncbi:MAG: hypothetical protein ABF278_02435 [Wenyingzhuangia sp.]|uniref:hypothetical protein n=1 Tax=Wenyingzhuangia sp. TaxID=1964193 RepID=UPI003218EFF5
MLKSIRKYFTILNYFLKYVVSCTALFYIGYRITNTSFESKELMLFLNPVTFLTLLFLSLGNWGFEVLKWKIVVETFDKISFKKATYETLVAYTYGIITPFNSGNYLKKIFFYPQVKTKDIVFVNLFKGIYQMIITLLFGSWGVCALIDKLDAKIFNQQGFLVLTSSIGTVVCLIFRKKIKSYIKSIPLKIHRQLFIYSAIKYLFFSFFLLYLLHQSTKDYTELYAGICVIYLLSSLLPIINILDFAMKGSIALFVLVPLGYSDGNILMVYFLLWLYNHATPAILGSILQFFNTKKVVL